MGRVATTEEAGATIARGMSVRRNVGTHRSLPVANCPTNGQGLISTHRGTQRHFKQRPYFHCHWRQGGQSAAAWTVSGAFETRASAYY